MSGASFDINSSLPESRAIFNPLGGRPKGSCGVLPIV
jgi:hypothetical protein